MDGRGRGRHLLDLSQMLSQAMASGHTPSEAQAMRGRSRLVHGLHERVANAFGDEEDEEDEWEDPKKAEAARVAALLARQQKAQAEVAKNVEAAVNEDPTVYQYDEVYEDMKMETKKPKVEEKKPKYVEAILTHAKEREKERDILMERKIAREIEKEAEVYGDVEKFVTAGYKRKLEERQAWIEEQNAREAQEEKAGAVPRSLQGHRPLFQAVEAAPALAKGDGVVARDTDGKGSPRSNPTESPRRKTNARASVPEPFVGNAEERDPSQAESVRTENNTDQACPPLASEEAREQKIKAARERYLMRKACRLTKT